MESQSEDDEERTEPSRNVTLPITMPSTSDYRNYLRCHFYNTVAVAQQNYYQSIQFEERQMSGVSTNVNPPPSYQPPPAVVPPSHEPQIPSLREPRIDSTGKRGHKTMKTTPAINRPADVVPIPTNILYDSQHGPADDQDNLEKLHWPNGDTTFNVPEAELNTEGKPHLGYALSHYSTNKLKNHTVRYYRCLGVNVCGVQDCNFVQRPRQPGSKRIGAPPKPALRPYQCPQHCCGVGHM